MKKKQINIETYAFFRMLERGMQYELDYYETKERAYEAVRTGKRNKKTQIKNIQNILSVF
ncbi:hypothetical protein GF358_04500 [Candidatus Woesearchaeota archaeon]|nr:hypothetical protein [Candidatus Woesearchaeota archaeon]